MLVVDVTRSVAFKLIESKSSKPVVAGHLRRVLGAVWDRALDAERVPDDTPNGWRQILRGKLRSKGKVIEGQHAGPGKRVLSEFDLKVVLPFFANFSRDVRDVCELYLWTACRGSEICAMERDEVARDAGGQLWWTVPVAKLKMRRNPLTCDLRGSPCSTITAGNPLPLPFPSAAAACGKASPRRIQRRATSALACQCTQGHRQWHACARA